MSQSHLVHFHVPSTIHDGKSCSPSRVARGRSFVSPIGDEADIHAALLHDFVSPPVFDTPLVPHEYQWPSLDSLIMYPTSSTSTSPSSSTQSSPSPAVGINSLPDVYDHSPAFPSSAELASMPIPPSRGTSRNKSPNHIPRPRNAFMLFRSAFAAAQKIRTTVEHDNRHITRIIAHCWNRLSDADKRVWREKAAAEKALHAQKYPNYRFSPVGRATKPIKRNVRRNGIEDKKRCEKVADLLLAGKSGEELEDAVKQIDMSLKTEVSDHAGNDPSLDAEESSANDHEWQSQFSDSEDSNIPPFRSPLLPPIEPVISAPVFHLCDTQVGDFDTTQASHIHHQEHVVHVSSAVDPAPWATPWGYCRIETGEQLTPVADQYQPFMGYANHEHFDLSTPEFSWGDDSFSSTTSSSSSSSYL